MRRRCAMSANWKSLKALRAASRAAGTMVYSTCTYNHIENEETIAAFLETHPDFELDDSLSLPGVPCRGGHGASLSAPTAR